MTTTTYRDIRRPILPFALILLVLFTLAVPQLAEVAQNVSHAVERHGLANTEFVRSCLQKDGAYQLWWNPKSKSYSQVCNLGNAESWGMQIVRKIKGRFEEITCFECLDMTLGNVENYLWNQGYMILH